jgi:hypothetical protein
MKTLYLVIFVISTTMMIGCANVTEKIKNNPIVDFGIEKKVEEKKVEEKKIVVEKNKTFNFEGKWQTARDYDQAWNQDIKGRVYIISKSSNGYKIKITDDTELHTALNNVNRDDYYEVTDIQTTDGFLGWKEGTSAGTKCSLDKTCKQMVMYFFKGGSARNFKRCRMDLNDPRAKEQGESVFASSIGKIKNKEDRFYCDIVKGEYVPDPNLSKSINRSSKKFHNRRDTKIFVRLSAIKYEEFEGELN